MGLSEVKKHWVVSQRCASCNKLHYIRRYRLCLAWQPRCKWCGGALKDTGAFFKREYKSKVKPILNFKCNHCDKRFRSEAGLNLHNRDQHENSTQLNRP